MKSGSWLIKDVVAETFSVLGGYSTEGLRQSLPALQWLSTKFTVIVVCTSVGAPFSRKGRYRAALMALIAAVCNIGDPLMTCRLSIEPVFEITASTTTLPSTCAAIAMRG